MFVGRGKESASQQKGLKILETGYCLGDVNIKAKQRHEGKGGVRQMEGIG